MTDIAGTEEPVGSDEAALAPVMPVPIAPAGSGVAVPAVVVGADPDATEDQARSHDDDQRAVIDTVADGVASILEPDAEES